MVTETTQPKQTTATNGPEKDLFGDMWGNALDMQRQWLGLWTRPLGDIPTPDQMWNQWHEFNTKCLDLNSRTADLMHHFVDDEVKIGRKFTEKTIEMTREAGEREPKETAPELTRELFDTARRGTKRAFSFGNESLQAFEEFGLNVSETMLRTPVEAK